ncbi:MAG: hypothetical protein AMXMBFR84_02600 [Candidatus Hydrogenedentota bacterium]
MLNYARCGYFRNEFIRDRTTKVSRAAREVRYSLWNYFDSSTLRHIDTHGYARLSGDFGE